MPARFFFSIQLSNSRGQQDDPVAHGENGAGTEEAMMPGYISIDRKSFGRYAYNIRKNQKNKVERWRHEDSTD